MLTSFKQFSLLAVPLLSHTSILLWLRNSSRWCSAVSPVSTLCLLVLLKVFCLILASAFSVLSVWPLVGRHNKLVQFPPLFGAWDPGTWLLGTTALECGGCVTAATCQRPHWNRRPRNCTALSGLPCALTSTLYGIFSATNFIAFAGTWETSSMALSKHQSSFVFLLHFGLPITFSEKDHIQAESYLTSCWRPADEKHFPFPLHSYSFQ